MTVAPEGRIHCGLSDWRRNVSFSVDTAARDGSPLQPHGVRHISVNCVDTLTVSLNNEQPNTVTRTHTLTAYVANMESCLNVNKLRMILATTVMSPPRDWPTFSSLSSAPLLSPTFLIHFPHNSLCPRTHLIFKGDAINTIWTPVTGGEWKSVH